MIIVVISVVALAAGGAMGYEIGNAKGFTDGYEVGRKYNKYEEL